MSGEVFQAYSDTPVWRPSQEERRHEERCVLERRRRRVEAARRLEERAR